jgi:hypothetical protein
MPRLLLEQAGVRRQLANIKLLHDGSIVLSLVRRGAGSPRWQWEATPSSQGPVFESEPADGKTKKISIHTTGRVNYHFAEDVRFLPCLLDLDQADWIVTYVVPSVARLDEVTGVRSDDACVSVPDDLVTALTFEFFVVPILLNPLNNELGRFGVEGLYALAWTADARVPIARPEVPAEAFTTAHPKAPRLPSLAIPEEVAYLRFRKTMYARDVVAAVENSPDRDQITLEHIEAAILQGPGLFPPNSDGVWTIVTSVPMRIAPKLIIQFEDPHLKAEVVDFRPADVRLATVRGKRPVNPY